MGYLHPTQQEMMGGEVEEPSYVVPMAGHYYPSISVPTTLATIPDSKEYNKDSTFVDGDEQYSNFTSGNNNKRNSYYSDINYPLTLPSTEKKYFGIRQRVWMIFATILFIFLVVVGLLLAFLYPRNPKFNVNSFYVPTTEEASTMSVPDSFNWTSGVKFSSSVVNLTSREYTLNMDMGLASNVTISSDNFVDLTVNKIDVRGQFYDSKGSLIKGDTLNITGAYYEKTLIKKRSKTTIVTPIRVQYDSGATISDLLTNPVTELIINSCGVAGLVSSTSGRNMSALLTVEGSGTMLGFTQNRNYQTAISFSCPDELKNSMQGFVTQVALGLAESVINQTASVVSNVTNQVLSTATGSVQDNLGDIAQNNGYDVSNLWDAISNGLSGSGS